ncbi:MAG TPA: SdrD B-like domain-containing protein [Vicinamibacterales bacterium]|nr:SdrD B-like domain-containing protein [Vicinamibacterales bacterium]
MSQTERSELVAQTQRLLDGPLKHIRGAALAAALLPLASIAATPAAAQTACASGGVCGTVFNDANDNGIQDAGETGVEGVKIFVCELCDGTDTIETESGPGGFYAVDVPGGTYTVSALIPTGMQASPPNVGDDSFDSDGVPNGSGYSVASNVSANGLATDFGFFAVPVQQPGTATPGYWKNHPNAWPVSSITVGGVVYTRDQAIMWLGKVGKDKTTTMFASLVSAMLSVIEGNDGSCVAGTITAANAWMATYGPVGSNVAGGSAAWAAGQPLQTTLDNYDNGLLCAPHRQ